LLDLRHEAPVASGEVLCAQVDGAHIAALARHAAAYAPRLVEEMHGMTGLAQSLRSRQPGHAGADDRDGDRRGR